jgi:hypothetical protein
VKRTGDGTLFVQNLIGVSGDHPTGEALAPFTEDSALWSDEIRTYLREENFMKNRQLKSRWWVFLIMAVLTVCLVSSAALAQQKTKAQEEGAKMMEDGWTQFNDGQRMVIKGVEMNNLVAVQAGFQAQMAPGNDVITKGRESGFKGSQLFAQGLKFYNENKADLEVAKKGLHMMQEGFRIAKDGEAMIEKGVAMNNQAAQTAGAADKFAEGNKVINDGLQTMKGGVRLFVRGETKALGK